MCICRTCTNTQPFVQPKTYRIFVSFAVVKMNLSCARSTYLIKKKNDSCQTVSLRLYKISSEGWREAGALLDASFLFYIQFVYSEEIPHKSWKKLLTRNRGLKQKSHRKVGRSRSVEIGLKLKNPTQNFEYPIAGWYWQNGKWCYNICEWFAYWRAADVRL